MAISAIRNFLKLQSAGGILLVAASVLALIAANSPGLAEYYQALLKMPMEVRLGPLELKENFLHIVNDGLMAIFFLLIALEIKREVLAGELSSIGQIILPGVAAVGGVIVPAAVYAYFTWNDPVALQGWVPIKTTAGTWS